MLFAKRFPVAGLIALAALFLLVSDTPKAKSQSQTAQSDQLTMQALLSEVHQLRLAMERSQVVTYRVQVTLERLRLQQGVVDSLNSSLGNLRMSLAELKAKQADFTTGIKNMEADLDRETDPAKRAEFERTIRLMKTEL